MTILQKALLGIFALFAIAFITTLPLEQYAGDFMVKAIPAVSLSILALLTIHGLRGKLLFAALLFCGSADAALQLGPERYFVIGLGLFLIAHILLAVTFSRDFRIQRTMLPVVGVLVIYSAVMAFILTPSLKEMAIPVYVYIAAITVMGASAALRKANNKLPLYGAVSFIVSDSILAVNKFMMSVPADDYLVMVTYYLALFLIVYGYVKQ